MATDWDRWIGHPRLCGSPVALRVFDELFVPPEFGVRIEQAAPEERVRLARALKIWNATAPERFQPTKLDMQALGALRAMLTHRTQYARWCMCLVVHD